jgi:anti-anti-sigma regulatory factor
MEYKISSTGDKRSISFSGNLTIENSGGVKSALILALKETNNLEIDISNVTHTDLSFLQLLFSLKKTAKEENLSICESGGIPPEIKDCYNAIGFTGLKKCLSRMKK